MKNLYLVCMLSIVSYQESLMCQHHNQKNSKAVIQFLKEKKVVKKADEEFKKQQKIFKSTYNNYTIGGFILAMEEKEGEN